MGERIDVVLLMDSLRHTLPLLVADAQKAHKARLTHETMCAELRQASEATRNLIGAGGALLLMLSFSSLGETPVAKQFADALAKVQP